VIIMNIPRTLSLADLLTQKSVAALNTELYVDQDINDESVDDDADVSRESIQQQLEIAQRQLEDIAVNDNDEASRVEREIAEASLDILEAKLTDLDTIAQLDALIENPIVEEPSVDRGVQMECADDDIDLAAVDGILQRRTELMALLNETNDEIIQCRAIIATATMNERLVAPSREQLERCTTLVKETSKEIRELEAQLIGKGCMITDMRFASFAAMQDAVAQHAQLIGFSFGSKPRRYKEQEAAEIMSAFTAAGIKFQKEKLFARGHFYCRNKDCDFAINFAFAKDELQFKLNSITEHNHEMAPVGLTYGFQYVRSLSDLTVEDRRFIESLSSLDSIQIKAILHKQHPKVRYHSSVINDVRRRFNNAIYGGPAAFDKFVKLGRELQQDGGIFHYQHNSAGKFTRAFMQPARMIPYAQLYGDYVQVDGTFSMCIDRKILLVAVVVDGLNHSVPVGWAFVESENSSVSICHCLIRIVCNH
jgi:hypothetical protein